MRHGIALDPCLLHNRAFSQRTDDDIPHGGADQGRVARDPRSWKLKRHHLMKSPEHPKGGKRGKRKRPTAAQLRARSALTSASHGWDDLTDAERLAWHTAGKQERTTSQGRTRRLTGQKYYVKINASRSFLGLAPLTSPPKPSKLRPNPVGALSIIDVRGKIVLQLSVPSAPAAHILVLGAPPQNAGRRFWRDFYYLGLLPAPKGGVSDITELYVKKFGNPPPGSRVFIQTRQQVDGQQDLPVQTDALVPGRRERR